MGDTAPAAALAAWKTFSCKRNDGHSEGTEVLMRQGTHEHHTKGRSNELLLLPNSM